MNELEKAKIFGRGDMLAEIAHKWMELSEKYLRIKSPMEEQSVDFLLLAISRIDEFMTEFHDYIHELMLKQKELEK